MRVLEQLDAMCLAWRADAIGEIDTTRDPALREKPSFSARGVLAVWLEEPTPGFEKSLERAGFRVRSERAGAGGRRHAVVLATRG